MAKRKKKKKTIKKKYKLKKRKKFKKNKKARNVTSNELIFKVPKKWSKHAYVDKSK